MPVVVRRALLVIPLLLALIAAGAIVRPAAAAGPVDQQNLGPRASGLSVNANGFLAQTFTVGRTGLLDQVALDLRRQAARTVGLTVQIRSLTAGGVPTNTVLATG